jgi:hypothetical protein
MSESSNMLFVTVYSKADALGDLTTTNAAIQTFAGAGIAVGFAAATAVAEGTATAAPYADATTGGLADGGFITSSRTSHTSIDFPYGPTPILVSVSVTSVATHGGDDILAGYSLSGLASPSIHGLLWSKADRLSPRVLSALWCVHHRVAPPPPTIMPSGLLIYRSWRKMWVNCKIIATMKRISKCQSLNGIDASGLGVDSRDPFLHGPGDELRSAVGPEWQKRPQDEEVGPTSITSIALSLWATWISKHLWL